MKLPTFTRLLPSLLCVAAGLSLSSCQDKEAEAIRTDNVSLQSKVELLQGQLKEAQTTIASQAQQISALQAEVKAAKEAPPAAPVATAAPATAPARPAGTTPAATALKGAGEVTSAPANLPYSLYTGILLNTRGEQITLASVNFGKIDRVPLIVNGGELDLKMGKIRYMRRLGKMDDKNHFPVSVVLVDGQEIRAKLAAQAVQGVDTRFDSKQSIPFEQVSELEFR